MRALHEFSQERAGILGQVMGVEQIDDQARHLGIFCLFKQRQQFGVLVFAQLLLAQAAEQSNQSMGAHRRMVFGADVFDKPTARLRPAQLAEQPHG